MNFELNHAATPHPELELKLQAKLKRKGATFVAWLSRSLLQMVQGISPMVLDMCSVMVHVQNNINEHNLEDVLIQMSRHATKITVLLIKLK